MSIVNKFLKPDQMSQLDFRVQTSGIKMVDKALSLPVVQNDRFYISGVCFFNSQTTLLISSTTEVRDENFSIFF